MLFSPARFPAARPRSPESSGFTLVGLLVALLISLLLTIAMLLAFKNVTHATTAARIGAQQDDRILSSLLSAGLTLHDAGFGIEQARFGTHVQVFAGAGMSGGAFTSGTAQQGTQGAGTVQLSVTGNAIIWQQDTGSGMQCAGLYAPAGGGMLRLNPVSCSVPGTLVTPGSGTSLAPASTGRITIVLDKLAAASPCSPFGIPDKSGHLLIRLSAAGSTGNELSESLCLMNFVD